MTNNTPVTQEIVTTASHTSLANDGAAPILSDKDWLEQQLDGSGIRNPLLREQFKSI